MPVLEPVDEDTASLEVDDHGCLQTGETGSGQCERGEFGTDATALEVVADAGMQA